MSNYDVLIIGNGIAGLTAAIYAGRADNQPMVLRGDEPGGQLTLTTDVENYPGFPDGISGPDLISKMEEQALKFGAEINHGIVNGVDFKNNPLKIQLESGKEYKAPSIIVASGSSAKTLEVPGEDEMMGYGLSTCATCDGAFFRGEDMLVVGGGDAAMEEAHFLTKFADTVYIAHRRDELRAEAYWQKKIESKVESNEVEILWNTELTQINGSQENGVDSVDLIHHSDGHPRNKMEDGITVNEKNMDVGAVFYAIGHTPNTEFLENTNVELTDNGYIVTNSGIGGQQTFTGVEGVYAAGDVVDHHYQQAVTAAGMGCKAAMDVDAYLSE